MSTLIELNKPQLIHYRFWPKEQELTELVFYLTNFRITFAKNRSHLGRASLCSNIVVTLFYIHNTVIQHT